MVRIEAFTREGLIGKERNLLRKLRELLKGAIKLIGREPFYSCARVDSLLQQAGGIFFGRHAMRRRLTRQFHLSVRFDVDDN